MFDSAMLQWFEKLVGKAQGKNHMVCLVLDHSLWPTGRFSFQTLLTVKASFLQNAL